MLIFISLAIAAFIIVGGSFMFGHDHDVGGDHDASHDVDGGHAEPTISIFSTKVMGTLVMGFGAAGAVATHYGASYIIASLIGVGAGIVLGGVMYFVLELFYKQQSDSLVSTNTCLGSTGSVTVSIAEGAQGQVSLCLDGQYRTFTASSSDGKPIAKGQTVRVVKTLGSHLMVERDG
jgi:membrane-bound ClpP family serine protease